MWTVGAVGAIGGRGRGCGACTVDVILIGRWREMQRWASVVAVLASDVAAGARSGRWKRPRHASSRSRARLDWPAGVEEVGGVGSHGGRHDGERLLIDKDCSEAACAGACAEDEAHARADMMVAAESAQRKHVSSVACHHSRIAAGRRPQCKLPIHGANETGTCMPPSSHIRNLKLGPLPGTSVDLAVRTTVECLTCEHGLSNMSVSIRDWFRGVARSSHQRYGKNEHVPTMFTPR